jgi:ribosomal protein L29
MRRGLYSGGKVLFLGDADCEEIRGREFIDNKEKLKELKQTLLGLEFQTVFPETQPAGTEKRVIRLVS